MNIIHDGQIYMNGKCRVYQKRDTVKQDFFMTLETWVENVGLEIVGSSRHTYYERHVNPGTRRRYYTTVFRNKSSLEHQHAVPPPGFGTGTSIYTVPARSLPFSRAGGLFFSKNPYTLAV